VYDELQANIYRDLGDPVNRFLDSTATSQLQDLRVFSGIRLAGKTITNWIEAIPSGTILLFGTPGCPSGFTQLASYGRFPMIADSPGATGGGGTVTDTPDNLRGAGGPWSEPGGKHGGGASSVNTQVGSSTHRHDAPTPLYKEFVFCQRT